MRRSVWVGIACLAAATAEAKPPRWLEANLAYCVEAQVKRLGARGQEDLRRLENLCEEKLAAWDREFRRRSPAYARAPEETRREVLSDAIDCELAWLGRPGTAYEACLADLLAALAASSR